jgi:hypothetical protein
MKDAQTARLYFTMLLSLIVLVFALSALAIGAGVALQNWAFGIIGLIVGHWLKGGRS